MERARLSRSYNQVTAGAAGSIGATALGVTGLTGAATPGRFVGVTTAGAPTTGTFAVADFVLTTNGNMFVCVAAGSPGTWTSPRDQSQLLATGEEAFDRRMGTGSGIGMTSGTFRLTYFTCRRAQTSTQVRTVSGSTAAAATPSLCRVGLYTIDAAGAGTLVASTANTTSLWAATSTVYTTSWSVSYALTPGVRYAFGFLCVSSSTVPTLAGLGMSLGSEPNLAPRLSAALTSQSDLPGSFTDASLGTTGSTVYAVAA